MDRSDPESGGKVPDEELEEIRRQLRSALAQPSEAPKRRRASARAPAQARAEPQRRRSGRDGPGPATMTLRFVGAFVGPGLVLLMILLAERLFD